MVCVCVLYVFDYIKMANITLKLYIILAFFLKIVKMLFFCSFYIRIIYSLRLSFLVNFHSLLIVN